MFLSKGASLSDIHCHLIPYVDDGAGDIYDAKALLLEEYSQGVRQIVMTPHFRYKMFDTSIEIVKKHYEDTDQICGIHILNRLDYETSGVVVFSKNR